MGALLVEYLLSDSGRRRSVAYSAFINYRLPDGTDLPILQVPAWCSACGEFVLAEDLPTIASLGGEIQRLEAGDPTLLQVWAFVSGGAPVEQRLAELRRRIEWRKARHGLPRCLHCGSPDVVPIPTSGEFNHPLTGERVVVGDSGFGDTPPWRALYSPEGKRLAE
jgi:hypothetical protein